MPCGHCVNAVSTGLTNLAGVSDIDVDLGTGTGTGTGKVTVTSDRPLHPDAVHAAIAEAS